MIGTQSFLPLYIVLSLICLMLMGSQPAGAQVTGVNSVSGQNLILGAGGSEFAYIGTNGGIALGTTSTFSGVPIGTATALMGILNISNAGNAQIAGTLSVSSASSLMGNVGIGIPSSSNYALGVNGSGYFSSNIIATGTVTAGVYYHSSDARLKTDVRPIDHALDKVLALKGVQFNWKKDGRPDIGVTAQNVAEVFPEIIAKNSDGMMSVEYANLVGPMIEAIRELKRENDQQAAEIKALRAEIEE